MQQTKYTLKTFYLVGAKQIGNVVGNLSINYLFDQAQTLNKR